VKVSHWFCDFQAVLLTGEQGTGKTVMVQGYVTGFDAEVMMSKAFSFSSATEPRMFQVSLMTCARRHVAISRDKQALKLVWLW